MAIAPMAVAALLASSCGQPADSSDEGTDYPTEAIDFVVPFGPGGGTDNVIRQLAPSASDELGTELRIENLPGVSGAVGMRDLAGRDADGYSVGAYNPPATEIAVEAQCGDAGVDLSTDLQPVGSYGIGGWVMVTAADAEVETYADVIDKYASGEWSTIASETVGSSPQVIAELMKSQDGMEWESYVGYEAGEIGATVLRDEAPVGILTDSAALPLVESEDLKVIAALYEPGSPFYPDAPTTGDEGYSDYSALAQLTRSIMVPEGTSEDQVEILSNAFETATQDEDVQAWAEETRTPVEWQGPEAVTEAQDRVVEALGGVENSDEIFGC